MNERLGTELPEDGPHTIGGLVFAELGRRPQVGDTVTIGGARAEIEAVDDARITSLLMHFA